MKTKSKLYLLAVMTAALSLNISTVVGQYVDSVESLNNSAVAASPRAREAFPWLARTAARTAPATTSKSQLAEVKENSALANSPRMRELFPELARTDVSPVKEIVATRPGIDPLTEVKRNRALADSPRMKELYPELARGGEKSFEIAPLK